MARLISLRYGATCVDCGKDLAPGTKARWFGRGRVSCCGGEHTATSTVSGSRVQPADDQPLDGEVYSLAGIAEGKSWADSKVDTKPQPPVERIAAGICQVLTDLQATSFYMGEGAMEQAQAHFHKALEQAEHLKELLS